MKILGIAHLNRNFEKVYDYIISHKPQKVLLEIDPKMRIQNTFFTVLEEKLQDYRINEEEKVNGIIRPYKTIDVIEGDICAHDACPYGYSLFKDEELLSKKLLTMSIKNFRRELNYMTFKAVKELLTPKIIRYRDKGMIKAALDTNPDLIVVGQVHAIGIKKYLPNTPLELCYNKKSIADISAIPITSLYAIYNKVMPHIKLL